MTAIETRQSGVDFIFVFAKIFNQAGAAARLAGNTGITSMQDQPVMAVDLKLGGDHLQKLLFHLLNVLARANCVRLQTRKMCVSTAMVGQPKAVFSTTLAVLRPTPGSASSAALSSGTSPLCCSNRMRQVLMTFSALLLNRPIVLIYDFTPSTPGPASLRAYWPPDRVWLSLC